MSLPPSPPADDEDLGHLPSMKTVARMLHSQSETIGDLSRRFNSLDLQDEVVATFSHSLGILRRVVLSGGKLVFTGMGKSHKIGSKLVATLHSFGIPAASLHPSDALHGDIGQVTAKDAVILISASGNSPEISTMIKHLPENCATICLTCNANSLLAEMADGIVLAPAEPQHRELTVYGLAAPTITTTLCLIMGDALCVALYECLERDEKRRRKNFTKWHPGGAIGLSSSSDNQDSVETSSVIPWESIPKLNGASLAENTEIQLWKAVARAPCVCTGNLLYKSSDVMRALDAGIPLSMLQGFPIDFAGPRNGICVMRNEMNEPTAVLWD